MRTSSLEFMIFIMVFALAAAPPASAQSAIVEEMPAAESMVSSSPQVPTTLSPIVSGSSSDPAVSAVLDRLKEDTTPLSISDMAAAQDTLARLNLLSEIEGKLSQIEDARQKRQLGALMPMGAMPGARMSGAQNIPAMPPFNGNAMGGEFSSYELEQNDDPEIVSISGAAGIYSALIKYKGRTMPVKGGSLLPDGSKVTSVNPNGVNVVKKGKSSSLSFVKGQ